MSGGGWGRLKSVMGHSFAQTPQAKIQRSSFNRSHGFKTTFDSGYLVPVFVDEVLPGDSFNLRMHAFARLSTPIVPIMDNMFLESFFFFVPNRLIWNNWEKFNGAQDNPGDSTDYMTPVMVSTAGTGYSVGSLHDYFGIPTGIPDLTHMSLWHRAYNLIWNDWFRDENLQNSVTVDKGDGPDTPSNYVLLQRGKRHDYFTSALPWPQKGTAVTIPLGTTAPVTGIGTNDQVYGLTGQAAYETGRSTTSTFGFAKSINSSTAAREVFVKGDAHTGGKLQVYADLTNASAATINSLRQSFQIQRLYERDARGGTRYTEILRSHFGVISPDARLQRPEYLGGGSSMINIHPVAQNSATGVTGTPQGNLSAFGTGKVAGHGFTKSFVEHGVLIGMVNVRADLNYQQGLNRMWSRRTRWDYFWPSLSHLGEQAVLNKEIYAQGSLAATDSDVFGYQERYAEYRYKPSVITGKFRSTAAGTLDIWHLAQKFTSLPTLNTTFIKDTPPLTRVMAVNTEPQFLLDCYFDLKCARPMPVFGVPGLIDHF